MYAQVEGSARSGVVHLHLVKGPGFPDWEYRSLALDVPGMRQPFSNISLARS